MINTFLLQIFKALESGEYPAARRFLESPFFNRRADVLVLFDRLVEAGKQASLDRLTKRELFTLLFPDRPYNALLLNHVFAYLTERLEQYLALVEMQRDGLTESLYRVRAFRRRGLGQLFERDVRQLEQAHAASPQRHAGWHLFQYQLQDELFSRHAVDRRGAPANLQTAVDALGDFFLLESLRWACTAYALQSVVGATTYRLPLEAAVRAAVVQVAAEEQPALALLAACLHALQDPDDDAAFRQVKALLGAHPRLFPPGESRDIYIAAINFCIRRQNRGERAYAREAFELYRAALAAGLLLENGVLPPSTYSNIHLLSQVNAERDWARQFLEDYRERLPAAARDNIYRYNLAIFHYRAGEHGRVLELLRQVEFSEVFIELDVRRMLLKSYYELGEWAALASLLDSFRTYLRRQKTLGYHRDSYLNLVKFVPKVLRALSRPPAARRRLASEIQGEKALAEREWLLEKLAGNA
jgi:hypothetical protein